MSYSRSYYILGGPYAEAICKFEEEYDAWHKRLIDNLFTPLGATGFCHEDISGSNTVTSLLFDPGKEPVGWKKVRSCGEVTWAPKNTTKEQKSYFKSHFAPFITSPSRTPIITMLWEQAIDSPGMRGGMITYTPGQGLVMPEPLWYNWTESAPRCVVLSIPRLNRLDDSPESDTIIKDPEHVREIPRYEFVRMEDSITSPCSEAVK